MEREPSIHITKSVFMNLLKEANIKASQAKVNQLFKLARGLSLDSRTMIAQTNNQLKQVRRTEGNIKSANLAAEIAYGLRIKLKHIGVTKTKQTDRTWPQIRELTTTLNTFCENNSLKQREGYLAFITIGFDLMNQKKGVNFNYWASWMLKHADWINNTYLSKDAIKHDEYPMETQQVMSLYSTRVSEMTGMYVDYSKNNNDYVHFIGARKLADKWGVDYETFIDAQFEALAFCNGIPALKDIDTDKAEERLTKYVAKTGIQVRRSALSEATWDSFKQ